MQARTWALLALLLSATVAVGQDAPKPEQLKKMYDDALAQLKAAQDRKTELAQENEQLKVQLAEATKEVDRLRNEMVVLKRNDADVAERTFFLRSQYAAWQTFLAGHADLKARWELFLEKSLMNPRTTLPEIIDPQWPMARGGNEN